MKINVIDIASTSWTTPNQERNYGEPISISVVEVDSKAQTLSKPDTKIIIPETTRIEFSCAQKTGVTPELIQEQGVSFLEACSWLRKEKGLYHQPWVSWSSSEKRALYLRCKITGIAYPFGNPTQDNHIILSTLFQFAAQDLLLDHPNMDPKDINAVGKILGIPKYPSQLLTEKDSNLCAEILLQTLPLFSLDDYSTS